MLKRATTAIALLALLKCADVPRLHAQSDRDIDERNRRRMLERLRPLLDSGGGTARFYYEGCWPGGFSRLKLRPTGAGATGLSAVQQLFEKDKEVTVTESPPGIIRISVGKAPTEILQTRIRSLRLKPEEQYTPQLALIAISGAPDVEAAMRRLGLEHPVVVTSIHVQEPRPGVPHLPPSIRNVTLDEAYDLVAKTFKGIVIYNVCRAPNSPTTFDTRFACIICNVR